MGVLGFGEPKISKKTMEPRPHGTWVGKSSDKIDIVMYADPPHFERARVRFECVECTICSRVLCVKWLSYDTYVYIGKKVPCSLLKLRLQKQDVCVDDLTDEDKKKQGSMSAFLL
jgi:hypothetical protein